MYTFYYDFDGEKVLTIEIENQEWFQLSDVVRAFGFKGINADLFIKIPLKAAFVKDSTRLFVDVSSLYRLSFEFDSTIAQKVRSFFLQAIKNHEGVWIFDLFKIDKDIKEDEN